MIFLEVRSFEVEESVYKLLQFLYQNSIFVFLLHFSRNFESIKVKIKKKRVFKHLLNYILNVKSSCCVII